MVATLLTWAVLLLGATPDDALAPWASNHHPTDVAKRQVQEITEGRAEYVVVQGGTMDGRNCRSPQGVWQPFQQTWESNRSVRMENVGETDVVNPWLSNGRNDFRSLDQIVARAVEPGMTDREKARALWWQEVQHRFHLEGDNDELLDPVKVFNVYGYNTCGNDSICLAGQWRKAGLKVAPARLVGHCVTQVFYDDAWHLMDGDMHSIYLLRDNETVAGEQDLVRDHDLIRRTHTQGILQPDRRAGDEWESSIYVFEGKVTGDRNSAEHRLEHDAASVRGARLALGAPEPGQVSRAPAAQVPRTGLQWTVGIPARTSHSRAWREGATTVESIREGDGRARGGGREDRASSSGRCAVPTSLSGEDSRSRGPARSSRSPGTAGPGTRSIATSTGSSRPRGPLVTCTTSGASSRATRGSAGSGSSTTSRWPRSRFPAWGSARTRSATPTSRRASAGCGSRTSGWSGPPAGRPEAPAEPVFPPAGGEADGTDIVFQWRPAADPDGDAIADYHFELSARADMKWPLSMSFAKLISRTADAGQARYTLPGPGLLNPDTEYFWRVRAQDDKGVWGPWSPTWSFTPRGPAPPREVASNSTASATGASSAGRPTRGAASPWRTVSMPATRRASPSATGPTRSRWANPTRCPPSSPRTSWSKPRPPSWRWWAPTWNSRARTRRSTGWSPWTRRASGAGLPTTPPHPGRSSSARP